MDHGPYFEDQCKNNEWTPSQITIMSGPWRISNGRQFISQEKVWTRITCHGIITNQHNYTPNIKSIVPHEIWHFKMWSPIRDGIRRVNTRHGSIYLSNTTKILPKPSKFGLEYRKRFRFWLLPAILTGVRYLKFQPWFYAWFLNTSYQSAFFLCGTTGVGTYCIV